MKIELSIAEVEFLKRLVGESDEWNNGARVADVNHKLTTALHEEGERLAKQETK